jgi:hypothetical protein
VYNENIRDLLSENSNSLNIMEDPVKGIVINDLKEISVENILHAKAVITKGLDHRAMNATKSN